MNDNINDAQETINPTMTEPFRWLHFLPRWSLIVALATLALAIVFIVGLGQHTSDNTLGAEYTELLQAVRIPGIFRALWTIDALIWLMLGVILIALGGILRRHAPIRSTFIAICGIGQFFGALGSFMRLDGISDLALLYITASPDQQVNVLESLLQLGRVINSSSHIGVLCQGVGFLLAAWGLFSLRGFPHWLAVWYALPGLLAAAQFGFFTAGAPYLRALNITGIIFGNLALNLAAACVLWRPSIELISNVTGESTEIQNL